MVLFAAFRTGGLLQPYARTEGMHFHDTRVVNDILIATLSAGSCDVTPARTAVIIFVMHLCVKFMVTCGR